MQDDRNKDLAKYRLHTAEETLIVATELFPKEIGRKLAGLQQKREQSDYDDFFIASAEEAKKQLENSALIVDNIKKHLAIE